MKPEQAVLIECQGCRAAHGVNDPCNPGFWPWSISTFTPLITARPMKPAECSPWCQECGREASMCLVMEDGRKRPLCYRHYLLTLDETGPDKRYRYLLLVDGDVARFDRDRAGGDVICDECGRKYYDHPQCRSAPFLRVLCDGSVVKL